jgi:hypothetical protein
VPSIGIDFGGSRLRVAAASGGTGTGGGTVSVLRHSYAAQRMPFIAAWAQTEERNAPRRFQINSLKRLLDFDSAVSVPPAGAAPLDVLVEILETIREECSAIASGEPLRCVLTVPPCFSERQRSALRQAAVSAGLTRVKLADDTLAAILANKKLLGRHENILVFSWGASTFSAILYQLRSGSLTAVAQEGDRHLGGDDLDAALCEDIWESLGKTARPSPDGDPALLSRIAVEAEGAKRALAEGRAALIPLSRLLDEGSGAASGPPVALPDDSLDSATSRMMSQSLEMMDRVLAAAKGAKPDLVLTVGGMARLPRVAALLEAHLGQSVEPLNDDSVAIGAAMHAAALPENEWEKVERSARPKIETPKRPSEVPSQPSDGWAANFTDLVNAAEQQFKARRFSDAVEQFEKVFAELGGLASFAYLRRVEELEAAGKIEDAYRLLARVQQRDPANRQVAAVMARLQQRRVPHSRQATGDALLRRVAGPVAAPVPPGESKVGRNDLCPCGSKRKYKHCGMVNAPQHKKARSS